MGIALASPGIIPSFGFPQRNDLPEGKFVDVHHHLGKDLLASADDFSFDPIIDWMDRHSGSQAFLLSAVEYPRSYYTGICRSTILP